MSTEMTTPYDLSENDPNWSTLANQYGDPSVLGAEWVAARKQADANRALPSGEPNPMYPRYELQEKVARLTYHMAYLLEKNRLLTEQVGIISEVFPRMAILEGSYSHLMTMVQGQKIGYYNKLKEAYSARQVDPSSEGGTR